MIGLVRLPTKVRHRLSRMPEDAALAPGEVYRCYEEALLKQEDPPLVEAVQTDAVYVLSMPRQVWASIVGALRERDVDEVLILVHPGDDNLRVAVIPATEDVWQIQGLRIERDTLAYKVGVPVPLDE